MKVFRVQRGGGHRDLPEAREEPLQEAVHAPRHHAKVQVSQEQQQVTRGPYYHAEVQVSKGEQQVTGTVLPCRSAGQSGGAAGYEDRVADKLIYRTYEIAVLRIRGFGAFLSPGIRDEKKKSGSGIRINIPDHILES
jgi:hypothetical protein